MGGVGAGEAKEWRVREATVRGGTDNMTTNIQRGTRGPEVNENQNAQKRRARCSNRSVATTTEPKIECFREWALMVEVYFFVSLPVDVHKF